jgi:hypothetical protein
VEKTKQEHVWPELIDCIFMTCIFNLWMSKGGHDIFDLIINFLGYDWEPKEMTIGLYKAIKTIGQILANNLTKLLEQYGLRKKIIWSNLNTRTITFKSIIRCEVLSLDENFQGICFCHNFFKVCQYVTTNL